ncbi:hypothetical protein [Candidatus Pelagibacter sp.]|uniref:hypothetical protein n=1 Tax=Candidatus Pelagibacter sp. TaxID=2024849 RepID=UPI003F8800AC
MSNYKKINEKNIFRQIYQKYFLIGKLNILYFPIIFGIIFYIYSQDKKNTYSAEIWLTKTTPVFENYFTKFYSKKVMENVNNKSTFEYIFISNLTSEKNFRNFLNKYKKIEISKNNKQLIKHSFSDFLYNSNNVNLKNAHNLEFYRLKIKYSDEIDGSSLLNDYIQFTIKEVLFYFIKISELNISERINSTKNSLEILDGNYDLLNSSINNLVNDSLDITSAEKENLILVFNTDFLNQKLRLYNKDLAELKKIYKEIELGQSKTLDANIKNESAILQNKFFQWDPVLKSQNNVKKVNHLNYLIKGVIFGVMICMLLIIFRIIIQRNILK